MIPNITFLTKQSFHPDSQPLMGNWEFSSPFSSFLFPLNFFFFIPGPYLEPFWQAHWGQVGRGCLSQLCSGRDPIHPSRQGKVLHRNRFTSFGFFRIEQL